MKQRMKLVKLFSLLLVGFLGMISCQKAEYYYNPEDTVVNTLTRPEMPPFEPKGYWCNAGDTCWVYNIYANSDGKWYVTYMNNKNGLVSTISPNFSIAFVYYYGSMPIEISQSDGNWLIQFSTVDSLGRPISLLDSLGRPIEFFYNGPVDFAVPSGEGYLWEAGMQLKLDFAYVEYFEGYYYYHFLNWERNQGFIITAVAPITEGSYQLEKTPGLNIYSQEKGVLNVTRSGRHYTFSLDESETPGKFRFTFEGDVIPHCYDYY